MNSLCGFGEESVLQTDCRFVRSILWLLEVMLHTVKMMAGVFVVSLQLSRFCVVCGVVKGQCRVVSLEVSLSGC